MNLNELVSTIQYPVPLPAANIESLATKDEVEKLMDEVEKLQRIVLNKQSGEIGRQLRLNRPLRWKYKWNGEKKYAYLDKERLEYWNNTYKSWYPVETNDGAICNLRYPGCWDD